MVDELGREVECVAFHETFFVRGVHFIRSPTFEGAKITIPTMSHSLLWEIDIVAYLPPNLSYLVLYVIDHMLNSASLISMARFCRRSFLFLVPTEACGG